MKMDCLKPDVPVDISDRITVTGITEGSIPSLGSVTLNVFDTPVTFYVMPDTLRVPGNGILGGEYFCQEKVMISYNHKSLVNNSRPIHPVPFLNPKMFLNNLHEKKHHMLPLRTPMLTLKARTRHVVPIELVNLENKKGFLPLIDASENVFIGNAAVSNENGRFYVMAYNVGYEDIDIQIAPQNIQPFDTFDANK